MGVSLVDMNVWKWLYANPNATICIDEIQLSPNLFSTLRSVIDKNRRNGRFILLGSASQQVIQKTSETLAGRVGVVELSPFGVKEIQNISNFSLNNHWFRGGFPDSYLANSDDDSILWLNNYIRTYIERDIPSLGFNIPSLQVRRLLTVISHLQGQVLNSSKIGESLGLTHPTVRRHIDILEQTFIVRTVQPFYSNSRKRTVKSPKIYIRDSGILCRLLGINGFNQLLGHPVFGSSWEGYVLENIFAASNDFIVSFYRTEKGNEIDFILEKGANRILVECKASVSPSVTKGFWLAQTEIVPTESYVVAPVSKGYPLSNKANVVNLFELINNIGGK